MSNKTRVPKDRSNRERKSHEISQERAFILKELICTPNARTLAHLKPNSNQQKPTNQSATETKPNLTLLAESPPPENIRQKDEHSRERKKADRAES